MAVGWCRSIPNRYIHYSSQAIDAKPNVTTTLASRLVGSIALSEILESHPGLVGAPSLFNILLIVVAFKWNDGSTDDGIDLHCIAIDGGRKRRRG